MKKLTMQDIANMSGVAKSTVSRYFNGGYVKEETRLKIKKVIDKNNYEPNAFAQSLKAKESRIIGVIAPCLDSTISGRMLMAIDEYLRKENYTSLFINTDHDAELELKSIENLWRLNVDGIILLATVITEEHVALLKRIDVPILFVGQQVASAISIIYDDYHAGYHIGAFVGRARYESIVYVGVDAHDHAVGVERKRGIMDGLASEGIHEVKSVISDFSYAHTVACMEDVFKQAIPDLLICSTDRQAMAAYHVIQQRGLHIPDDISVIGFGGYDVSEVLTPRLTTIRFDAHTAGFLAGESILKMIHEETLPQTQVVDFEFLEGASTK